MFAHRDKGMLIGLALASTTMVAMSWLKNIHMGVYQRTWMLPLAIALYACTPLMFLYGLNFATLTVLNLTWDMFSDVLVTLVGIFYFKEAHTKRQLLGIFMAFGALYLFTTGAPQ